MVRAHLGNHIRKRILYIRNKINQLNDNEITIIEDYVFTLANKLIYNEKINIEEDY